MGRRVEATWVGLLAVACLAGCQTQHYLVSREAPFYAGPAGEDVLTSLPAFHHEALPGAPEEQGGRIEITYRGERGWVAREDVRLFSYLDPALDDGEDRAETVQRELRVAQVAHEGGEWSHGVREAVEAGEVQEGMTRAQVELAWGWPATVEAGSQAGGERWIYRVRGQALLRSGPTWDPWWGWSLGQPCWDDPWCSCGHPGWRWGGCRMHQSWARATVPVVEERRVEFDANGRVVHLDRRRWLDDGV